MPEAGQLPLDILLSCAGFSVCDWPRSLLDQGMDFIGH